MQPSSSKRIAILFFAVGLLLVSGGLLLSVDALTGLAGAFNTGIFLGGVQGLVRLWLIKLILIIVGLPLLVYPFRTRRLGKPLFDVSMGLVLMVLTLLLIEGAFGLLNAGRSQSTEKGRSKVVFSNRYVEPDAQLGFRLLAGATITATQTIDDRMVYQVSYAVDENGRRVMPVENVDDRQRFALFFGGSFTFGDGLEADELLPVHFGRLAPNYMPYNFGVSGYGPQQSLGLLQYQNLPAEVTQPGGIAIFSYICDHVNRVVGTMRNVNAMGPNTPYYTLDENGQVVHRGNFVSGRPLVAVLYAVLGVSETVQYFNLSIPRINDSHYRLTAEILAELERELRRQFNDVEFFVVLYPGTQSCAPQLAPHLDDLGVTTLDYSNLFAGQEQSRYFIPDGHPTGAAQRAVAEQLVRDLSLTPAASP